MVKTPEKEEERKPNAKRKHQNAPLMKHSMEKEAAESSKNRLLSGMEKIPAKPRSPQAKIRRSSSKLAELRLGGGKNHSSSLEKQSNLDDNEGEEEEEKVKKTQVEEKFEEEVKKTQVEKFEEEEVKKTQVEEKFEEEEVKKTQVEEKFEEEEVKKTQIEEKFEEEEVKRTQVEEKMYSKIIQHYLDHKEKQSASVKKNTILGDKEEELEKMGSKRRNLDGKSRIPHTQIAEKSNPMSEQSKKPNFDGKNQSASSVTNNTILDDDKEEVESEKMRSKRRNLDGKSRTPQAQIGEKLRIGYSIDGRKLQKPGFGYSIDGAKLPKHPKIKKISKIIGACSKPFEKKLLKTDVERIGFHRDAVKKNGIYRILKDDEKAKLRKGGIPVDTYDEFGNRYEMTFDSYNGSFYKLSNGWNKLYEDHQLKENEDCYVDVWMFRNKDTDKVCFAVILKR